MNNIRLGIIIDTDLSIPPKHGVGYRLYYLSRALIREGVDVKIFLCNRNIYDDGDLHKLFEKSGVEFYIIPEKIFYNVIRMKKIIEKAGVDLLQTEDPASLLRYYSIAVNLKKPICLEMHDVEATLQIGLGFSKDTIELSKATTRFAVDLSARTICMTSADKFELINYIGVKENKLELVPNSIDTDEFKYYGPQLNSPCILFIGNMFYWPNKNAAKFIVETLYPKIIKKLKNARFTLVGMVPESIKKLAVNKKNITFIGSTDNLDSYLKQSSLALCPVAAGSGMKVKILNYCAAGLPVICTKLGSSGYENIPSLIIEDNLNKYASLIINLFNDIKRLRKLGKNNRDYVKKNYENKHAAKKMRSIYEDILNISESMEWKNVDLKKIKLPNLLWLNERRTGQPENNKIYIIKNEKII